MTHATNMGTMEAYNAAEEALYAAREALHASGVVKNYMDRKISWAAVEATEAWKAFDAAANERETAWEAYVEKAYEETAKALEKAA